MRMSILQGDAATEDRIEEMLETYADAVAEHENVDKKNDRFLFAPARGTRPGEAMRAGFRAVLELIGNPDTEAIRNAAYYRGKDAGRMKARNSADKQLDALLDALRAVRHRAKTAEGQLRALRQEKAPEFDPTGLKLGIYRVFWHSGGCSPASIGQDRNGKYWLAPANWISDEKSYDWSPVERVELVEAYTAPY